MHKMLKNMLTVVKNIISPFGNIIDLLLTYMYKNTSPFGKMMKSKHLDNDNRKSNQDVIITKTCVSSQTDEDIDENITTINTYNMQQTELLSGFIELDTVQRNGDDANIWQDNSKCINFGILKIKTEEIPIINYPVAIFFTVDASGSMSDICSDKRTKMQHVIHTLTNMLRLFATMHTEHNLEIYVEILTFNNKIQTIFELAKITADTIPELIQEIETKIIPDCATNIELALTTVEHHMNAHKISHPTHKIIHINMTDGEATDGEEQPEILCDIVSETYNSIYIGFGDEHDSYMLKKLAKNKNDEYRFIDKLENSPFIYGEIVNNILYCAFDDVHIQIVNGLIYDWKTNAWVEQLYIGELYGNSEKVFHVKCTNASKSSIYANIVGNNLVAQSPVARGLNEKIDLLPALINEQGEYLDVDLSQYMYRQRTQELLYEVVNLNDKYYKIIHKDYSFNFANENNEDDPEYEELKKDLCARLKTHFELIRAKTTNENKVFMKLLCDDIYIAYNTFGTRFSHMYVTSRQTTQGRQQTYNVTNLASLQNSIDDATEDLFHLNTPKLCRRRTQSFMHNNNHLEEDDYELSQSTMSPYANTQVNSVTQYFM